MSRARSLSPEKQAALCSWVAEGRSIEQAAARVGVTLRTVQREIARDEDFELDLRLAEQAAPANPLKLMEQAARTHWRAAAWLLERTDERYARRRPASCGPEQFQAALAAVIEAALEAAEPAQRKAVYQQAQAVAEQALRQIFPDRAQPPLRAPAGIERNVLSREPELFAYFDDVAAQVRSGPADPAAPASDLGAAATYDNLGPRPRGENRSSPSADPPAPASAARTDAAGGGDALSAPSAGAAVASATCVSPTSAESAEFDEILRRIFDGDCPAGNILSPKMHFATKLPTPRPRRAQRGRGPRAA